MFICIWNIWIVYNKAIKMSWNLEEKLLQEILIISCQIDEEQGNALWVATLMY